MSSMSNEVELRKKLLEIHDYDVLTFDSESVLNLIERISSLVMSGRDGAHNGSMADFLTSHGFTRPYSVPDTLPSMLHKISCELSCKCSGEDISMEILKLLKSYDWEAKVTIILATFVVEYVHFTHLAKLYSNSHLGGLVAVLKQIRVEFDVIFSEQKSTFASIIQHSIKVTRSIAKFSNLPSKYISKEEEPMAAAMTLIPILVYNITKVVVSCASQLTEILGRTEMSLSMETLDYTSFEQDISSIHVKFEKHLQICQTYIEEKKQMNYILKLKLKFHKTAVCSNNQKILQLLLSSKEHPLPLVSGLDRKEVGVEVLKRKTVLLLISDLEITKDEIDIITRLYKQSRKKEEFQYEIVWLPIVENMEQDENMFEELKLRMPWHSLQHLRLLKPAVVRFVKEEWHYSTKSSILVTLDPRGKVANPNAYKMLYAWGNAAYPFTQTRELDIWSRREWSLDLLVEGIDERITTWMKEKKIICLYGGENHGWIDNIISKAREIKEYAEIELEMMYIGHDTSEELMEHLENRSYFMDDESRKYFWKRMEIMGSLEIQQSARVSMTVEAVRSIHRVGQGGLGWAVISQGSGLGSGKIAWGKGDVILEALEEFEGWKIEAKRKGFVAALNGYLAGRKPEPEISVCNKCHRPYSEC